MAQIRRRPDSITIAMLVCAVGGAMDAYTYIRYGVFANSQTGNIVLAAVSGIHGRWDGVFSRLTIIVIFLLGLVVAEVFTLPRVHSLVRRPTRLALGIQIVLLVAVGFLHGRNMSMLVTGIVAFVAALQVSTFHSLGGFPYVTTMATGNLRRLVEAAFGAIVRRDPGQLRVAAAFAGAIASFVGGVILGAMATGLWGRQAIWAMAAVLAVVFVLLVFETRRLEQRESQR